MASAGGADEENGTRSVSTSQKSSSKQLFFSGAGSHASNEHYNANFVRENVVGTVTEQKCPIPSFADLKVDDTARDIGNAMISVEKGELKEVEVDKSKDSFQSKLRPGFEKMLEICIATGNISANVRQGSDTSTDVGNFKKCAITSRPDITIVVKNDVNKAAVCGVCEVKVDAPYGESARNKRYASARNQLYVELVTKQRSTRTQNGAWLLTGLILTEKRACITQLRTGTWWGYLAEVTSIDHYDFDATDNVSRGYQMLAVIREYLQRLFTNFRADQLFCATHELAYFAYPSTPDIVRFSAPHIVKCRFETVRKYLSVDLCDWSNKCGNNDEVVVKVVSNAVYNSDKSRLSEFLKDLENKQLKEQLRRMELGENATTDNATASGSGDTKLKEQAQAEQPKEPPNYVYSILANHVWMGSCTDNQDAKICVTRWLGERVCRSTKVLSKWTMKDTRQAFFDHVCTPALGAIQLGYYHGDIRLPNIVVQEQCDKFQFSLIDWDEMVKIDKDRGVKNDRRYPTKFTDEQHSPWKNNAKQWAELFTMCQLYMCVTILNMVASAPDPEVKASVLECQWKEEAHFWEQQCPKNPIHSFDERNANGLSGLRDLMKTGPNENLSNYLSNLLNTVLKLA